MHQVSQKYWGKVQNPPQEPQIEFQNLEYPGLRNIGKMSTFFQITQCI